MLDSSPLCISSRLSAMPNHLATETSPYLLQHVDNPVDWHPWGEAALSLARREDKPILLSIGYSACHWCHVMAHESFEDTEVAAVMNELFVNIKVDREERPDLDQIYQSVHNMLTGRAGGWPLTLFLTPDGTPYYAGTYFPKAARYGLPGFPDICIRLAEVYHQQRDAVEKQNASVREALARTIPESAVAQPLEAAPIDLLRTALIESFDSHYGGFGGAPKFPHPTDVAFLLRRAAFDDEARNAALTTLTRMAEGGIYDQLGGGFARYSVDARWEIPHFEKMLYDNGPLLSLYADAWVIAHTPLFQRVAEETVAWVMREMQSPEGGYYSSLDADSEGEEGKFTVWDRDEVRALLNATEWEVAASHWGLNDPPNFENSHWNLKVSAPISDPERALLSSARTKLFKVRAQRIHPGRDDKILTSWNALMIQGMARAARVFGRSDWLASARQSLDFIRSTLWRDGRLLATYKDNKAHLNAYLDDYAFLLAALIELMQTEFQVDDLDFATQLADVLLAQFEDREHGGFFFTSHDHEALIHRPKPGVDNATPSGNGVAAVALQRLGHLLGEPRYLEAARRTLECYCPQFSEQASGFAVLIEALDEALTPPESVILRGPAAELGVWQKALSAEPLPHMLTLALPNELAGLPPALAKPKSDAVNAWVCQGVNCLPPIASLEALVATVSKQCSRIAST